MRTRPQRMIDAALVAAVVALVTALAHTMGGGTLPSPLLVGAATVWSLWCSFFAGGTASLPRTVLAVALSQPVMHLVFATGDHSVTPVAMHDHAGAAASVLAQHSVHNTGDMTLAHTIAGLISIVVLRSGARAIRRAWRAAARSVLRVHARPIPVLPVAPPAAPHAEAPILRDRLARRSHLAHRGPPAALAI